MGHAVVPAGEGRIAFKTPSVHDPRRMPNPDRCPIGHGCPFRHPSPCLGIAGKMVNPRPRQTRGQSGRGPRFFHSLSFRAAKPVRDVTIRARGAQLSNNRLEHPAEVTAIYRAEQDPPGRHAAPNLRPEAVDRAKRGGAPPPDQTKAGAAKNAPARHVLTPRKFGHEVSPPSRHRCANQRFPLLG